MNILKLFYEDVGDLARSASRHASPVVKQYEEEIENILDHRTLGHSKKNQRIEFLVHLTVCDGPGHNPQTCFSHVIA